MVTDLVEIRRLGQAKEPENRDFRRYLKIHHHPERLFREVAQEVASQIDCQACANCCRQTIVSVSTRNIQAIARHLAIEPEQVASQYTVPDPSGHGRVLRATAEGCVFLDGNLCMIYDARPRPCREFPYAARSERSLGARMSSICRRAWFCPIVYNALESYKKLVGYHPSQH